VKSLSYLKKNADDSNRSSFVETSYLNTDMCKFETTQKWTSRAQSAVSSNIYSKTRAFIYLLFFLFEYTPLLSGLCSCVIFE